MYTYCFTITFQLSYQYLQNKHIFQIALSQNLPTKCYISYIELPREENQFELIIDMNDRLTNWKEQKTTIGVDFYEKDGL